MHNRILAAVAVLAMAVIALVGTQAGSRIVAADTPTASPSPTPYVFPTVFFQDTRFSPQLSNPVPFGGSEYGPHGEPRPAPQP